MQKEIALQVVCFGMIWHTEDSNRSKKFNSFYRFDRSTHKFEKLHNKEYEDIWMDNRNILLSVEKSLRKYLISKEHA